VLAERIRRRVDQQLRDGFLDEVRALERRPKGLSRTAGQALGYGELAAHLRGECTLDEAVDTIVLRTRQFAVRQIRWFRRDPRLVWFDADADMSSLLDGVDALWRGVETRSGAARESH
jgi:tRNA dimethylallyltransferase